MTGVWNNNWKGMKNRMLIGGRVSRIGLDAIYDVDGNLISSISNAYGSGQWSPLNSLNNSYLTSGGATTVRFGTSDTTPSTSDIDLGSPWSSNITYVSVSNGSSSVSGSTVSRTLKVTVQNTATATVTVREFGLFTAVTVNSSSSTTSRTVMMYRAVLDSPVDIAQYESATLTFTVSMTLADPGP